MFLVSTIVIIDFPILSRPESIELFDITLPTFYYNISEYLQNTKLWFSIPFYFTDPIELTMPSGYYTYNDICIELTKQLNNVTTQKKGLKIPIVNKDVLINDMRNLLIIILPWNIKEELIQKIRSFVKGRTVRLLIPFPTISLI